MVDRALLFCTGDIDAIKMLRGGIVSYGIHESSSEFPMYAYINLQDKRCIYISTTEGSFGDKFDVFTLKFEIAEECPVRTHEVQGLSGSNQIFVLVREEWHEPFVGDESQLVGTNPVTQSVGRPGSAPKNAIPKGIVAGGVLICGDQSSLLILSDVFPKTVQVIVDDETINRWLELHEEMELDEYLKRFQNDE